jgi:hypothetical protein
MTRSVHHYVVFDIAGGVAHASAKDETGTPFDQIDNFAGPAVPPN